MKTPTLEELLFADCIEFCQQLRNLKAEPATLLKWILKERKEAFELGQQQKAEEDKAKKWIVGDDTGLSSITIWCVMMGVDCIHPSRPHDKWDLGRCERLLKFIPEWIPRLEEVSSKYPEWKEAVTRLQALTGKEDKE